MGYGQRPPDQDAAHPGRCSQLALLIDGAAARTRVIHADAFPAAAAIAAVLIDTAIPATAGDDRRREEAPS